MTCYAMACKQERPCASMAACEAVWHACTPPPAELLAGWTCGDCAAVWRVNDDGNWHRIPLHHLTGVS